MSETTLKVQGKLEVVKLKGDVKFFKPKTNDTQYWMPTGWALRDTATGFFLANMSQPNYPYILRRKKDIAPLAESVTEWGAFAIADEPLATP